MAKRRPRQPRPKARHTRRAAVAKNPSNVKYVDRQLVPYRSARGQAFALAYNVETKHANLAPQTSQFAAVAASSTQPKNTKCYFPAMWDRNTDAWNIDGNFMTPCYINQKFRISFDKIVADHADSEKGFNLRMHVVRLKITPSKFNARVDTLANFSADCEANMLIQLVNSNMTSDFLTYARKNRDIQIVSTEHIKPNRNNMIRKTITTGATDEVYSAPSPICKTVNHKVAKIKTRVLPDAFISPSADQFPANLWVPAVVFQCEELSLNTGTFTVEHSSRTYYQDM